MPRKYTKEEIITRWKACLDDDDYLYRTSRELLKYRNVKDDKIDFIEFISGQLLLDIGDLISKLKATDDNLSKTNEFRRNHYGDTSRLESIDGDQGFQFDEGMVEKGLYNSGRCYPFGILINHQIPLKEKQNIKGPGKIDLLGYYKDQCKIIELKIHRRNDDDDSLLHSIIQAVNFSFLVNMRKSRFYKDFGFSHNITMGPAVLTFDGSRCSEEMIGLRENKYPTLRKFIIELNIQLDLNGIQNICLYRFTNKMSTIDIDEFNRPIIRNIEQMNVEQIVL